MQRLNSGVLFKNDDVEGNRPAWGGSINVDGVQYFIDAWVKHGTNDRKFLSLAVKRKNKQADTPAYEDFDL